MRCALGGARPEHLHGACSRRCLLQAEYAADLAQAAAKSAAEVPTDFAVTAAMAAANDNDIPLQSRSASLP